MSLLDSFFCGEFDRKLLLTLNRRLETARQSPLPLREGETPKGERVQIRTALTHLHEALPNLTKYSLKGTLWKPKKSHGYAQHYNLKVR
ncbi:hypothetical protein [Nostoc sp.]|uniref:hypothetical protein n=1 Tax=Nostoc sp. TaxID=1180 RepID=UPI002FFC75E5